MKKMMLFFLMLFSVLALADSVKIEVSPQKPVAGETFQVFFKIQTESSSEPDILFTPLRLEVVGKNRQGISTRTVYANGKLSITREMIYSYDMVAGRDGIVGLRDIQVTIDGKVIKHPPFNITVLKEAEVLPEVFVMAEVSKRQLYVGEGVVARYYIYAKTNVNQLDVKKYPKLNNFLKRFLQEPERTERVAVNGEPYNRSQIYAAKLFPEKPGKLKVDPLTMSVVYTSYASNQYGFGYGPRDQKTKTISSETIELDVIPLPEEGKPSDFTGLVGKHEFNLQVGNTKLIVNEPLELKLTVSGNGALENFEAPKLLSNVALEEFESNADLKLVDSDQGIKTFDYTYLAKTNLKLNETNLSFSYFDPDKRQYVKTGLKIPELVIAGGKEGAINQDSPKPELKDEEKSGPIQMPKVPTLPTLQAPDFFQSMNWLSQSYLVLVGLSLLVIVLFVLMMKMNNPLTGVNLNLSKHPVPSSLKKEFDVATFYHWMAPWVERTGKTPLQIINEGSLADDSKRYFVDLLAETSYKSFGKGVSTSNYRFERKHYSRLAKMLEQVKDESHSSFRRD